MFQYEKNECRRVGCSRKSSKRENILFVHWIYVYCYVRCFPSANIRNSLEMNEDGWFDGIRKAKTVQRVFVGFMYKYLSI